MMHSLLLSILISVFQLLIYIQSTTSQGYVSTQGSSGGSSGGSSSAAAIRVIEGGGRIYILKKGAKHSLKDGEALLEMGFHLSDVEADVNYDSYPEKEPYPTEIMRQENSKHAGPRFNGCPCRSSFSHDISDELKFYNLTQHSHMVCLVKTDVALNLFQKPKLRGSINHRFLSDLELKLMPTDYGAALNNCDVVLKLVAEETDSAELDRQCPGTCKPVPYLTVPMSLLQPPYDRNRTVTCTLTLEAALNHGKQHLDTADGSSSSSSSDSLHKQIAQTVGDGNELSLILRAIMRRRVEECLERGLWPLGSFSTDDTHAHKHMTYNASSALLLPRRSKFQRRKVYGVVMWIGGIAKMQLVLNQTHALRRQSEGLPDHQKMIGWVATEHIYPCRADAPMCPSPYAYHWMLPASKMRAEATSGWGCAQKRPLRALAHALLLLDPAFLLVVDDDTWVNMDHLLYGSPLSRIIQTKLRDEKIVLGQLNGGNKVTNNGFFYGGAGYLMGRAVLDALTAYSLDGPSSQADQYRNNKHLNHLGVMEDIVYTLKTREGCAEQASSCIHVKADDSNIHFNDVRADLRVRLVDICANVFSEEDTCYHSDHALSRCLVHGVYADVWNVDCSGVKVGDSDFRTGMCMGTDVCWDYILTCHRWVTNMSSPSFRAQLI